MSSNQPSTPAPANGESMFVTADGQNVLLTFTLVSSLFLLWGFCNGMIDVMDKHFQEELHLSLSPSAWVQFAHWMGYFLTALPAGWLAARLGYKGGIIAGLLLVALGGLPAILLATVGILAIAAAAVVLDGVTKRLSRQSIWAHEHFSGATLAQFFYVAAQAGIFSFLINYVTSEPPGLPAGG